MLNHTLNHIMYTLIWIIQSSQTLIGSKSIQRIPNTSVTCTCESLVMECCYMVAFVYFDNGLYCKSLWFDLIKVCLNQMATSGSAKLGKYLKPVFFMQWATPLVVKRSQFVWKSIWKWANFSLDLWAQSLLEYTNKCNTTTRTRQDTFGHSVAGKCMCVSNPVPLVQALDVCSQVISRRMPF